MKRGWWMVLVGLVYASEPAVGPAAGGSPATEQLALAQAIARVNAFDAQATTPALKNVLEHSLAKAAHVPVGVIAEQRQKTTLAAGDLLVANVLAKESGATFEQIKAEHATRTWAASAAAHRVKGNELVARLQAVEKDFTAEMKKLAEQERKAQQAAWRAQQQAERRLAQQWRREHRRGRR